LSFDLNLLFITVARDIFGNLIDNRRTNNGVLIWKMFAIGCQHFVRLTIIIDD